MTFQVIIFFSFGVFFETVFVWAGQISAACSQQLQSSIEIPKRAKKSSTINLSKVISNILIVYLNC